MRQKDTVILEPNGDGGYSVTFPHHESLATTGKTREEALANAREAFEGYIEARDKYGEEMFLTFVHMPGAQLAEFEAELSDRVAKLARREAQRWGVDQPAVNRKQRGFLPVEFAPNIFAISVGDGANTVFLIKGRRAVFIDAGREPADADTLLEYWANAGKPEVQAIILTHRHWDHIAGAKKLAEVTGAKVLSTEAEKQYIESGETPVKVDRTVENGEAIDLGGATIEIVHTPGHTFGSLCIYHREGGVLFTGDTVLGSSPTSINPEHGDMTMYLESLRKLLTCDARIVAPGHGPLMRYPRINIEGLIAHRLAREAQILDLVARGHNTNDSLFHAIYAAEVEPHHHEAAKGQIRAHLIKLQREGKVALKDGRWLAYAVK